MKFNLSSLNSKQITKISIVAAIYIVSTLVIAPIGYGPIQFRLSEILNLLVFFNPMYGISLVVGCALSNIYSPLGIYDMIFGTLATFLTVVFIAKSKNLFVASLWPTLFCFIIGIELHLIQGLPLVFTTFTVMAGEFVVMTLIAYPIFKVLMKNQRFIDEIKK